MGLRRPRRGDSNRRDLETRRGRRVPKVGFSNCDCTSPAKFTHYNKEVSMSIKVQVIFYSLYGHVYRMAEAVAEGARSVTGATVDLYQVAETLPKEILEKMGAVEA